MGEALNVKVVGYEDGKKESVAELSGVMEIEEIKAAAADGIEFLSSQYDGKKARELKNRLKRVFIVIECGPVKKEETHLQTNLSLNWPLFWRNDEISIP